MTTNTTCRLCLSVEGEMEEIFSSPNSELHKRIYECTNIEMKKLPGLPSCICQPCKSELLISYKFKQQCLKTTMILKSIYPDLFKNTNTEGFVNYFQEEPLESIEISDEDSEQLNDSIDDSEGIYSSVEVYYNKEFLKQDNDGNSHKLETTHFKSETAKDDYEKANNESKDILENCMDLDEKESRVNRNLARILIETESTYNDNSSEQGIEDNNHDFVISCLEIGTMIEEDNEISKNNKTSFGMEEKESQMDEVMSAGNLMLTMSSSNLLKYQEVCPICGQTSTNLKRHMLMHRDDKPFVCKQCGRGYRQKVHLQHHILAHTSDKPFNCNFCYKRFSNPSSLRRHIDSHKGEVFFHCELCDKSFMEAAYLVAHQKTHAQDRRHKCEYCEKKFLRKYSLKEHIRTHTGEKPYKCDICTKHFATVGNLQAHKRVHTKERPFKCTICEKTFGRKRYLIIHYMKRHGQTLLEINGYDATP